MTDKLIRERLAATGIRVAGEAEVPINNVVLPLPYLVIRQEQKIEGSDNGLVQFRRIEWQVVLFTADRDDGLNRLIQTALRGVGKIDIVSFPDLSPYQTTFKFKTAET